MNKRKKLTIRLFLCLLMTSTTVFAAEETVQEQSVTEQQEVTYPLVMTAVVPDAGAYCTKELTKILTGTPEGCTTVIDGYDPEAHLFYKYSDISERYNILYYKENELIFEPEEYFLHFTPFDFNAMITKKCKIYNNKFGSINGAQEIKTTTPIHVTGVYENNMMQIEINGMTYYVSDEYVDIINYYPDWRTVYDALNAKLIRDDLESFQTECLPLLFESDAAKIPTLVYDDVLTSIAYECLLEPEQYHTRRTAQEYKTYMDEKFKRYGITGIKAYSGGWTKGMSSWSLYQSYDRGIEYYNRVGMAKIGDECLYVICQK